MAKGWQQLESSITRGLLKYLRARGGYWSKIHGNPFQPRLIDIVGCWHGRFVALEVKRPGADATPKQEVTMAELRAAGALVAVVHSRKELENFLEKALDGQVDRVYDESINRAHRAREREPDMPRTATKSKAKAPSKKSAREEPEDELEDLDDLDDFDEEDLDEEEDEDEDEEDEAPARRSRSKAKPVAKASTKATKTTAKAPAKVKGKSSGNAGNLSPRRVTEGLVGVAAIAEELDTEARTVRVHLRKLEIAKSDTGVYEWKPNSRDFKSVVSQVRKSIG